MGRAVSLSRVVAVEVCAGIAGLELSFGIPGERDYMTFYLWLGNYCLWNKRRGPESPAGSFRTFCLLWVLVLGSLTVSGPLALVLACCSPRKEKEDVHSREQGRHQVPMLGPRSLDCRKHLTLFQECSLDKFALRCI